MASAFTTSCSESHSSPAGKTSSATRDIVSKRRDNNKEIEKKRAARSVRNEMVDDKKQEPRSCRPLRQTREADSRARHARRHESTSNDPHRLKTGGDIPSWNKARIIYVRRARNRLAHSKHRNPDTEVGVRPARWSRPCVLRLFKRVRGLLRSSRNERLRNECHSSNFELDTGDCRVLRSVVRCRRGMV